SNEYGTYKYENIEISGDTLIITQRIKDGTAYSQSSLEVNPENFTMGTELVKTSIKLGTTSMNTNGLTGLFESNWSDLRTGGTDLPKTDNKNPGLLYFQSQFDDSALEEYITLLEEQKRINELKNGDDYDNGESALSNLFNSFKDNFGYKDDENNYIQGEFTSNFNRAFLSAVSPLESLNIANIKTAENFIKNQTTWAQRVFSYFVNVVGGGLDPSMWIQNEINNIVVEKISIELKRLYPGIDLGLIKLILSDRTNSQTRNQANNELDSRLFNSMIYSPFITAPINTDYSFLQNKMPDEVGSFLRNFVSESLDLSGKFVNVDFSDTIRNIKGKDLTPFLYQGLVDYKAEVSNYIRNQSYENLSGILGREWNLDPKLISTVWKELDHRREQERIDEAKRRQNLQTFVQVATMIALQAFPGIGQVVGSYLFPSFSFSTSLGQGIVAAGSGLLQASIASSSGDSNTTSAAFVNGLFSVLGGNQGLLSNYALNLNYTPPESSNTLGGNLDLFINRFLYNNDSNSGYGGGVTYGSSRLNFGMNYAPNSGVELTLGGLVDKLFEGGFYNYSYNLDSGFSNFTIGAGAEYSSNLGVN
ncbi:MAG: hypothetical protein KDK36_17555, partial [Leptospiraceae bacterium]|nr:hypothetical protein [Leptospiraceae bacterium]